MANLGQYDIRKPDLSELPLVQQLRHDVLDPARADDADLELDWRDSDEMNIHMAAFLGERIVSTLRIDVGSGGRFEVVRVATDAAHRRLGLAGLALSVAEDEALWKGATEFCLGARLESIPFYLEHGYQLAGPEFMSRYGVINRWMVKKVADG